MAKRIVASIDDASAETIARSPGLTITDYHLENRDLSDEELEERATLEIGTRGV
ncbi:hypothetical protein OB955_06835 [Halobacteria archaeon AArc-m2/3/4]|uniref:Uncharacterized protein n=1 Tax=Natronoglomus mannanivorans TaxID=2979990 RepID=A0AAP3E1G1_9EURY|nr:hypothetical protein [Halobacteria archaeon AArc-xg1-1]MCU4972452.1 hypothetical protein [Halobacteria archaeon AArc-m2/3/4]